MQWNDFYFGLLAGFIANWIFVVILRLIPSKWIRYKVEIVGCGEIKSVLGHSSFVAHVFINYPKIMRLLREPSNEYLVARVLKDDDEFSIGALWMDDDVRKTQALIVGATSFDVLLCEVINNKVYLGDSYPEGILYPGRHTLSLAIRFTSDGVDADKTDIVFEVDDNGLKFIEYKPGRDYI